MESPLFLRQIWDLKAEGAVEGRLVREAQLAALFRKKSVDQSQPRKSIITQFNRRSTFALRRSTLDFCLGLSLGPSIHRVLSLGPCIRLICTSPHKAVVNLSSSKDLKAEGAVEGRLVREAQLAALFRKKSVV